MSALVCNRKAAEGPGARAGFSCFCLLFFCCSFGEFSENALLFKGLAKTASEMPSLEERMS